MGGFVPMNLQWPVMMYLCTIMNDIVSAKTVFESLMEVADIVVLW